MSALGYTLTSCTRRKPHEDGRKFVLTPGMSYQVGDNAEAQQSYTRTGAKLFVVD
ncbi:hypothetical protein VSR83_26080 [Paraburkholderia unamae]|uniref:Uncharacterized protein n=1 Tax=Paraburkholderia unamae TaxID=219649 RepID=A0ACC6RP53_9BURK